MNISEQVRPRVWTERLPYLASGLLWAGNLQQVHQMVLSGSVEGQSLSGWASVFVALIVWQIYYSSHTPGARSAIRSTWISITITALAIGTMVLLTL